MLFLSALMAKKPSGSKSWTKQDLENAVVAIREEKMSMRKAVEAYGVPKSTLYDHVKGKVEVGSRPGPPTVLYNKCRGEYAGRLGNRNVKDRLW